MLWSAIKNSSCRNELLISEYKIELALHCPAATRQMKPCNDSEHCPDKLPIVLAADTSFFSVIKVCLFFYRLLAFLVYEKSDSCFLWTIANDIGWEYLISFFLFYNLVKGGIFQDKTKKHFIIWQQSNDEALHRQRTLSIQVANY